MQAHFPLIPFESFRTALLATLAAALLVACGAGGGDPVGGGAGGGGGSGGVGGTGLTSATISTGVMTKGSAIVNGVRFDDTTAKISIDDTQKTPAELQNGMVVKLVGKVNDDGINGTAELIKALIEVRGKPSAVPPTTAPRSLLLNGQTVLVDDQTIFSNLSGFDVITTLTPIEVHGLRGADGRIRATRIEGSILQMVDSTLDEIRGVVVADPNTTNPTTFSIAGQQISFSGTVIPSTATWQNGSVVEVYCSNAGTCILNDVFQASRLKVEDAQDALFQPASGQRVEVEGLISGFTPGGQNFSVGTTPVTINSSTTFEDGVAADLADNVKVEAEGSWNGTRLVASKIEFKRSVIRLQGNVTASSPTQLTLNVAGNSVTIEINGLTSLSGGPVPPPGSTCVQVRGQRKGSGTPPVVTAAVIDTNCSGGGGGGRGGSGGGGGSGVGFRPLMVAPVEAETSTTITLLGFKIDISNPIDSPQWEDVNGQPITTLPAFLDAVTPATTTAAGTLVKVTFDDRGTNAVSQAEIED